MHVHVCCVLQQRPGISTGMCMCAPRLSGTAARVAAGARVLCPVPHVTGAPRPCPSECAALAGATRRCANQRLPGTAA